MDTLASPVIVKDALGRTDAELDILQAISLNRRVSWKARSPRADMNKLNWDFYHGRQDWSHKMPHQSREFLPDFPMAVERIAAAIEGGLTESNEWFDVAPVGLGTPVLDPQIIRHLLLYHLNRLYVPGDQAETAYPFAAMIADAAKFGILEAMIVLKVYAIEINSIKYFMQPTMQPQQFIQADGSIVSYQQLVNTIQQVPVPQVRLVIEPIPWEDFFPDPTGANEYDIHEVSVPVSQIVSNPDYDPDAVQRLIAQQGNATMTEGGVVPEFERRRRTNQNYIEGQYLPPRIREHWGNVIRHSDGKVLVSNGLVVTAGDSELLLPPGPNPFWHGRRPFVKSPLIRVPLSVTHKALADHMVPVARAINEVTSLALDGALASVWGIRQMRPELLDNPDEVAAGVPQGYTGVLRPGVGVGEKFLERVDDGAEPQYGMDMLNRLGASFQTASALTDTSMGVLPPRQVKATELVQTQQASQGLYAAITARLEKTVIGPTLELAWLTLMQFIQDFSEPEIVQILGLGRAAQLQTMTPEQRFVILATAAKFDVKGLREKLSREQDFPKLTTLLQSIGVNPALLQAFDMKYDVTKLLGEMIIDSGLDPARLERDPNSPPLFPPGPPGAPPGPPGPGGPPAPGGPAPQQQPGTVGNGMPTSSIEKHMAPANPKGFRGTQQ